MNYTVKRKLRKLGNKEFADDIKKYIRSSHYFYEIRVPELKILAKRLHEEYKLKEFYKVFDKLWYSGYHEERALSIHAMQLYKEEFDLRTWNFLKSKLIDLKSWDEIDSISSNLIGYILLKIPELKEEIIKLANSDNIRLKRAAIISTAPLVKEGNIGLTLDLAKEYIKDNEEHIQKATGWILKELGTYNPEALKKFVEENIDKIPALVFNYATESNKSLRKLKMTPHNKLISFFSWSR